MQLYRLLYPSAKCPSTPRAMWPPSRLDSSGFISLLCHPFPLLLYQRRGLSVSLLVLLSATIGSHRKYFLRLALNCNPPGLCLLRNQDYRNKPLVLFFFNETRGFTICPGWPWTTGLKWSSCLRLPSNWGAMVPGSRNLFSFIYLVFGKFLLHCLHVEIGSMLATRTFKFF
jgi:hypothetical protein